MRPHFGHESVWINRQMKVGGKNKDEKFASWRLD
jgi:hypothetical protein